MLKTKFEVIVVTFSKYTRTTKFNKGRRVWTPTFLHGIIIKKPVEPGSPMTQWFR